MTKLVNEYLDYLNEFIIIPDKTYTASAARIRELAAPWFAKCNSLLNQKAKQQCLYYTGLKVQKMLSDESKKCSHSKNPSKCKQMFDREINAGNQSLEKLKNKLKSM